MTIAKLNEILFGKAALLEGKGVESSIFVRNKLLDTSKLLLSHGYNYEGKDILISP